MDVEQQQPRRGRPPRSEETAQRRRRRGDTNVRPATKLEIPPEIQERLDREGLVGRWVNDEGNRIARLTQQDDYDPVEGVEPVPAGRTKEGRPVMAHLLAKPRAFIEEDEAKAEERRKAVERGLFRSPEEVDAQGQGSNPNPATAARYVDKNSSLGRGNQILEG